jgi:hypothetical protein
MYLFETYEHQEAVVEESFNITLSCDNGHSRLRKLSKESNSQMDETQCKRQTLGCMVDTFNLRSLCLVFFMNR